MLYHALEKLQRQSLVLATSTAKAVNIIVHALLSYGRFRLPHRFNVENDDGLVERHAVHKPPLTPFAFIHLHPQPFEVCFLGLPLADTGNSRLVG